MLENTTNLFAFLGGLGMFLYGMHIMADGMQKAAGGKMQKFLGMLTNNRIMGICLGALITAIIQSSGATTVMVVGFVSAGILTLDQAVGVIMGANIGTTITAWIVSLSQVGDAAAYFSPEFYAPVIIAIGTILIVFCKTDKKKTVGEALVGVGLLFMGLKYMSSSVKPYTSSPIFSTAFATLGSNPILGIITGAAVTAILQSSSVSVGILQTLALNGVVTTNAAVFLTLGQNIGSCVTALISSIGSSRTARRASVLHLSFNMIGAIIFGIGGFVFFSFRPLIAVHRITSVEISLFHTGFNLFMTALLFPFAGGLVRLSGIMVKGNKKPKELPEIGEDVEVASTLKHLDPRIFETPAFAVETAANEVVHMGQVTLANVKRASEVSLSGDENQIAEILKFEKTIDNMENILTEYLIKVDNLSLNERQKIVITNLFNSVTDIERVGDHVASIADNVKYLADRDLSFSGTALSDLKDFSGEVTKAFANSIEARRTGNLTRVRQVMRSEDDVDTLEDELREKHIERLSAGECTPAAGIIFADIISNFERIADHALNLADYVKKEM